MGITGAGMVAALLLFCAVCDDRIRRPPERELRGHQRLESRPRRALRAGGFERHGLALLLVGLLVLALAYAAGIYGSRPAAAALAGVGALVLAIALLDDLPVTNKTGALGRDFQGASASAGVGLYLELAAGALALGAGAAALLAPRAPEREDGAPDRPGRRPMASQSPGAAADDQPAGGTTSGSGRTPCSPGPSGRCRPCACRPFCGRAGRRGLAGEPAIVFSRRCFENSTSQRTASVRARRWGTSTGTW